MHMRALMIAGVILVVLGVAALAYQGVTYTQERTVIDIGPFKARVEEQRRLPLPPIVGAAAVIGGIILVVVGTRNRPAHTSRFGGEDPG